MVDRAKIDEVLSKIVDPEVGVPITEMKLVDKVEIGDKGDIRIDFHLTAPFCPPIFALKIAQDIKQNVGGIDGVSSVNINLKGHYMADYINRAVNKPATR